MIFNDKIYTHFKLIEAEWCKHESVQHIYIALDNGSSPIRRPGIIWTNAVTSSIRPKGKYFSEFLFKIQKVSFQGNAPEIVVCEMAVILSRPQCVNSSPPCAAYKRQWTGSALVQVIVYHLFGTKPLPNQCWLIVNLAIGNKFQWNSKL